MKPTEAGVFDRGELFRNEDVVGVIARIIGACGRFSAFRQGFALGADVGLEAPGADAEVGPSNGLTEFERSGYCVTGLLLAR